MALDTKVSNVNVRQEPEQGAPVSWKKYAKPAAIVLVVLILGFGAWFAYEAWVVGPKKKKHRKPSLRRSNTLRRILLPRQ